MDDDLETGETGDQAERPAAKGLTRDEIHERDRAAFLAEMGDEPEDGEETAQAAKPGKAKPAAKPVVEDADDEDDELEAAPAADDEDEDDDDADEDDDENEQDPDEDDEDEVAAKDPDLAKRLAAVRRTEQRQREQLERQRTEFARERDQWQQESRELREHKQRFDQLAARAKYDSFSVLIELGVPKADIKQHAEYLYAHSDDPKATDAHRAAAARAMRERELADKAESAVTKAEKLEKSLEERERAAAAEREVDTLLGRVTRKADPAAAPITAALIAKSPKAARAALMVTAFELIKKQGLTELPRARDVIAAHEKKERRALRDRGIEPPAPGVAAEKSDKAKPTTGAKPTGKPTPAATNGTSGRPKIPTREEMLREMAELDRANADN